MSLPHLFLLCGIEEENIFSSPSLPSKIAITSKHPLFGVGAVLDKILFQKYFPPPL
jgi:hypothetical protein